MEDEKQNPVATGTEANTGAASTPATAPESAEQPQYSKLRLPHRDELEMFGVVVQLNGSNQVTIRCEDGKTRGCRIPGKMKKKTWLRERDVVIIRLWSFQQTKADVVWRFIGAQTENLRRRGYLKNLSM